jgi:hypothetical protein
MPNVEIPVGATLAVARNDGPNTVVWTRAGASPAPTNGKTYGIARCTIRRGVLHTPSRCIAPPICRVECRAEMRRAEIRRVKTRRYLRTTPTVLPLCGGSMPGRTPEAFNVDNPLQAAGAARGEDALSSPQPRSGLNCYAVLGGGGDLTPSCATLARGYPY